MDSEVRNEMIKSAIEELIQDCAAEISLAYIDEVVFSYIAGLLDETSEDIDLEEFITIMDAYVPGFSAIPSEKVSQLLKTLRLQVNCEPAEAALPSESGVVSADVRSKRRRNRRGSRQNSESEVTAHSSLHTVNFSAVASRNRQPRTLSETSSIGERDWPVLAESTGRTRLDSGCGTLSTSASHSNASSRTNSECYNDCITKSTTDILFPRRQVSDFSHEEEVEANHNNMNTVSDTDICHVASDEAIKGASAEAIMGALGEAIEGETSPGASGYVDTTSVSQSAYIDTSPVSQSDQLIDILVEMFPDKSTIDIKNGLARNSNDLEATVVYLLEGVTSDRPIIAYRKHRPTKGSKLVVELTPSNTSKHSHKKQSARWRNKSNSLSNDEPQEKEEQLEKLSAVDMKAQIVSKYSYIPTDADAKTYAPKLQVNDEKKMVRYRNSQVVSTKGDRYSDVKPTN